MRNAIRILSVAVALAVAALPGVASSARIVGPKVTGSVTSMPGGGRIEIDNHVYHVKPGSNAERALQSLHMGQVIDAELDPTVPPRSAEVIAIGRHVQS